MSMEYTFFGLREVYTYVLSVLTFDITLEGPYFWIEHNTNTLTVKMRWNRECIGFKYYSIDYNANSLNYNTKNKSTWLVCGTQ